jgi:hypothetical protein
VLSIFIFDLLRRDEIVLRLKSYITNTATCKLFRDEERSLSTDCQRS